MSQQTLAELYAALAATRDAYASATWEEIPGLQTRQRAILAEIQTREHAADAARCQRAGLPTPPAPFVDVSHVTDADGIARRLSRAVRVF